jgi:hypothetical protein
MVSHGPERLNPKLVPESAIRVGEGKSETTEIGSRTGHSVVYTCDEQKIRNV